MHTGFRILLALGLLVFAAAGCEETPLPAHTVAEPISRPAADALDHRTAAARAARVSDVHYDLAIDLAADSSDLLGEVSIRFELSDVEQGLTLDFTGGSLQTIRANGTPIDADYNGFFIALPASALRVGDNTIEIRYRRPFGNDGTGLHRFVDPEDGRTYLHSYLWPYYANRMLPAFDQPNLKAVFNLSVVAPAAWEVVSTSPGRNEPIADDRRRWQFEATPPISTYIFSLHAGPYEVWQDNSGDVPLRLMARQSLAEYVAVDEWFELTQHGMQFFQDYFEIPYPFAKYDQLIVPEFNIGGMENAAAVTYTEAYVQRQPSTRAQRERRAGTILHELAHMWFGDLVTHDWWNGMWLNESFATQMETLALLELETFNDRWHGFFVDSKPRAYSEDRRDTTHPIEMPVVSTDQFYLLFDAITYQKGASALKQLQFRVGAENYRRGVSNYLQEHAWGTTELADFIGHQSRASDVDLGEWSQQWLLQAGFNSLRATASCGDGLLRSVQIEQGAPADWPVMRTHKTQLAFYNFDAAGQLSVTTVMPVVIDAASQTVPIDGEQPCPAVINPNYEDYAYARFALSNAERTLLAQSLAAVADPFSRSMFLDALYQDAMTGVVPIADYVRLGVRLAESEQNFRVLQQLTQSLAAAIDRLQRLRPETAAQLPRLLDDVEVLALRQAEYAPSDDLKRLWLGLFIDVAASPAAIGTTAALLDGKTEIAGIDISADIRWRLLQVLSRHGVPGIESRLAAEIASDLSDFGQRNLLAAQAAAPAADNKSRWLEELQNPQDLNSLARQRAVMTALFPGTQTALQLQFLPQVLAELPRLSRTADRYFLSSYSRSLLAPMCLEQSSTLLQATLDEFGPKLDPTTLRFLRDARQTDAECAVLRTRQ